MEKLFNSTYRFNEAIIIHHVGDYHYDEYWINFGVETINFYESIEINNECINYLKFEHTDDNFGYREIEKFRNITIYYNSSTKSYVFTWNTDNSIALIDTKIIYEILDYTNFTKTYYLSLDKALKRYRAIVKNCKCYKNIKYLPAKYSHRLTYLKKIDKINNQCEYLNFALKY